MGRYFDSENVVTQQNGSVDIANSSVTPLDPGVAYEGSWVDTLNYNCISIGVVADQDSSLDGFQIQWSSNGVTLDQENVYTLRANSGKQFTVSPINRYYRLKYENGAVLQTFFSLQSTMKKAGFVPSSTRVQDSIKDDEDCQLIKAVIAAKTNAGEYINVGATEGGFLQVAIIESGLAIVKGDVPGTTYVHKFGNAPDFDSADGVVTVWDGANDGGLNQQEYVYSTNPIIDSISSSDNADTQTITVQGLDTNWELHTQDAILTGQTRKALDTPLIRCFRMFNKPPTTELQGNVYVYENTGLSGGVPTDTTKVRAMITLGNNQTLMSVYTIPANNTGYMRDWFASTAGANKDTSYITVLKARPFGGVFQTKHVSSLNDNGTSSYQHRYVEPEKFAPKTDVEMRVSIAETNKNQASISAGFDVVLVED